MNNILNITSKVNIGDIIKNFLPIEIDYLYTQLVVDKRGGKHYFTSISFIKPIESKVLAEVLSSFIIDNYEEKLLIDILNREFIEFSNAEAEEIIETAKNSIKVFNQIYNKIIFVKNLTNYLNGSNYISIEGFLNFRTSEYKRIVEMVLADSIEKFFIKEEYNDFIDMLKSYISYSEPQIDLLHIKPNIDGTFLFYNFKKERIIFEIDNVNPIEIFVTNNDILMSILITLIPKRIIWHRNSQIKCDNIETTIKNIFEDRVTVCSGCELCND